MMQRALFTLAALGLFMSLALFPAHAVAEQPRAFSGAGDAAAVSSARPQEAELARPSAQLFDQDELEELAALEAGNAELQEQTAGFFGPRIGTIIVIAVLLVVLL